MVLGESLEEYQEKRGDAPPKGIQAQSQHFDLENVHIGVDDSYGTCLYFSKIWTFQEH